MSNFTAPSTEHTCRKDKQCTWCGGIIKKGEKYKRWVGKYSGDFSCLSLHTECESAAYREMDESNERYFEVNGNMPRGLTINEEAEILEELEKRVTK